MHVENTASIVDLFITLLTDRRIRYYFQYIMVSFFITCRVITETELIQRYIAWVKTLSRYQK